MASFQYIVKDAKGVRVEGAVKAASMDEAIEKLTKEGSVIISVKSASEGAFQGRLSLFEKVLLTIYKIRTGVSLKTLVFFTRQMATMFSAGLTIEKSLSNLAKEEKSKKFKKVLVKLAGDIKKGFSLSEAMEQHPGVFNALYISLVKAGEVSGTLHTVLDELAEYQEKIEDTRRKVTSALSYPIFILVFLAVVIWALFYFIIPMFAGVYESFDADLPGPTRAAIAMSEVIREHIFLTFVGILAAFMAFFLFYLSDRGRYVIDKIILKLPVIGNLLENSIMSKFARTFSILMYAGVPIMETMELVENVVQNAVIENAIRKARVMVKEGYSVAGAFKKTGVFPPTLLQLMATGEETGDMDALLRKAGDFHQKLVDSVIERLTSLIEPILIIIMAGMVGYIIIIIYLPIFNLGLAISSGLK
ncbi:MAG: type II secretion system F family protein [Candidatus Cloacimonetes bacterium]|nr:type II secretion system F family protein [Candidatus Cloacimonadota bacterium]MCF7814161.1 type II secretion system F family protein [Candidatus Cloacimonadota bacterium]MCF7868740.1 type II secretion system F family protein [Candidatus Cloacimonadota bacterium]MCF7884160.1 type II secretion system F family protein [Candidatus Cloacimonadota bacterium]